MTRRTSECFRNLDDPLKIFSLITVKSCGLVLMFYAAAVAVELVFGVWTLGFGPWSFLAQIAASGALAMVLALAERHDDEHLVPSAIRYYASRRWAYIYGGAFPDRYEGHVLERRIAGWPWPR